MEKDVYVQLRYGQTRGTVLLRGGQICSFHGADGREVIWQTLQSGPSTRLCCFLCAVQCRQVGSTSMELIIP